MTNEALNRILALPAYLERHSIYKANTMFPHFGIRWADGVIRQFEATPSPLSITYKVDIYLEGKCHDGELEVRRDGTHAIRLIHKEATA